MFFYANTQKIKQSIICVCAIWENLFKMTFNIPILFHKTRTRVYH